MMGVRFTCSSSCYPRCGSGRTHCTTEATGPKRGCQSKRNASGTCTKIRFWVKGEIISTIWTSILKGNDGNVHIHTYSYLMWCLYRSFQRQKDVSGISMTGSCISSLYISPFSCCSWRMLKALLFVRSSLASRFLCFKSEQYLDTGRPWISQIQIGFSDRSP